MNHRTNLIVVILFIFLSPLFIYSQNIEVNENTSVSDTSFITPDLKIFNSDEVLNITLRFDITSFIKNKNKDKYQDAVLKIEYQPDYSLTKIIELKPRGNFRKDKCFFPPIRLKFEKESKDETGLAGNIKLVTHCSTDIKYRYYLLKEYLAYKIYNLFTDYSFRVRILYINYVDTGTKKRNYNEFGFIIEPLESLIKRTGTTEVDPSTIYQAKVDQDYADLVALFEFMIGHTDWRIEGGHNLKYIRNPGDYSSLAIPVPYDFDFSGFVGTSYSYPQVWTSLNNVWEREYLGYCRDDDEIYLNNIKRFNEKREQIMEIIKSCEFLTSKEKEKAQAYLEDFFMDISKPEEFIYTLKNECRDEF